MDQEEKNHWIILLLEDDEEDYILVRDAVYDIEDYQITLHWMHIAKEALNALCEGNYDAVLVDHRLDLQNGIEIIHAASAGCTETPKILMSSLIQPDLENEALAKGAAAVLQKDDLTCQGLRETLLKVIRRKPRN